MKKNSGEIARENFTYRLNNSLNRLNNGDERDDYYFDVALYHRLIGMLMLLLEADQQAFVDRLCRSGYARLYFLKEFASRNAVDPPYLSVYKDVAFSASLAAGNLQLARQISEYSSKKHDPSVEYEDDYLFPRFMQRVICEDYTVEELNKMLDRWEVVLEGENSEKLNVCKALLMKNEEAFTDAFGALVYMRQQQLKVYKERVSFDEQVYAAEGHIYIDGISVLRIAEMRDLPIKDSYPLIPHSALRLKKVEFPTEDSWKVP